MIKFSCFLVMFFSLGIGTPQASLLTKKNKNKVVKITKKAFDLESISLEKLATKNKKLKGNLFAIKTGEELIGHLVMRRVHGCKIGGCEENADNAQMVKYVSDFEEGSYETFDYFMVLNQAKEIIKVHVIDYPGDHGYEVSSKRWLRQFQGYTGGDDLSYGKTVDAISGATISGNSITSDIKSTYQKLIENL